MPLLLLLLILLLAPPSGGASQTVLWGGYGQNTDYATGLATGETFTAGVAHLRYTSGIAATVGLPADPDGSIRWGTAAGWFDQRALGSPYGVAGGGSVFAYSDPILERSGAGTVAWLDGYRVVRLAPAELRLRLGARHGMAVDGAVGGDATSQRLLGRAGTELGVRAGVLDVRGMMDHWRAGEGGYTQAGARVALVDRRIQAWAGLSTWLDDELSGTGWDVGAQLALTDRVGITARGGVQAQDILFQIPRQRSWSVALQVRTGAAPPLPGLPVPVVRDGRRGVSLTLESDALPENSSPPAPPAVAGTFSGWERVPMRREGGRWVVELTLEPGVYEYAFVTAEGEWFVPPETPGRKPDGFGGHVALLIVQ